MLRAVIKHLMIIANTFGFYFKFIFLTMFAQQVA